MTERKNEVMEVKDLWDLEDLCKRLGIHLSEDTDDSGEVWWSCGWDEDGLYVIYTGYHPAEVNVVLCALRKLEQAGYIRILEANKGDWDCAGILDTNWIFLGATVEINEGGA